MRAGALGGLEIVIKNDTLVTEATVKLYPHVMKVEVDRRKSTDEDLWNEIKKAFHKLHASKDVQF
jgi:hypothetical protein